MRVVRRLRKETSADCNGQGNSFKWWLMSFVRILLSASSSPREASTNAATICFFLYHNRYCTRMPLSRPYALTGTSAMRYKFRQKLTLPLCYDYRYCCTTNPLQSIFRFTSFAREFTSNAATATFVLRADLRFLRVTRKDLRGLQPSRRAGVPSLK